MIDRVFDSLSLRSLVCLTLLGAACNSGGGDETGGASTSGASTSGATDDTGAPTTSGASSSTSTSDSGVSGESATGSTSATSEPTTTTDGTSQGVDTTTDATTTSDGTTIDGTSTGDTGGDTGTDGSSSSSSGGGSSTTGDTDGCVPTEDVEVSCDGIDNDCDESVDNVDVGKDGICDCLNIAILGAPGYAPNANFEQWIEQQGSAVTRTLLLNNPGAVTGPFLAQYDLVLLDRIERALSPEEAAALASFVKDDGRGLITLIGYNFDNDNPGPERDRANTALAPFGLAYQGGYFGNAVTPTFDQNHPISKGIFDVNFAGGIAPVDTGKQGTSTIFATVQNQNAGLAHQTAMMGGRVIVWGDEWITFDSDWQGYADVQDFWVNMVSWAKPNDFCGAPQ